MSATHRPLTRDNVARAHELIKPHIHLTPVLQSSSLSALASSPPVLAADASATAADGDATADAPARPALRLFFKCENQQKVGAFKARGAFHALARLRDDELQRGVVTHSSGACRHVTARHGSGA